MVGDRSQEFADEAHPQSAVVAAAEHDVEDQASVDAVSIDWEDAQGENVPSQTGTAAPTRHRRDVVPEAHSKRSPRDAV